MKKILETVAGLVAIGVAIIAAFIGYGILESWRSEHTAVLLSGGFMFLIVIVLTVGWIVNNGLSGAQRRRDDDRSYAPPPPQNPIDLMRYENARIAYERQRLGLERDRQKMLPQPAARDPLEEFYNSQQNFFLADQHPAQVSQPAPPLLTGDDEDW